MSEPTKSQLVTVNDVKAVRNLSAAQEETVEILLSTAQAKLRLLAKKYHKDIDALCSDEVLGEDYKTVIKATVIQSVLRALDSMADVGPAVTQSSQSGLGYSATYTYLNAGQAVYFLKNELKDLGFLTQQYGSLEVF